MFQDIHVSKTLLDEYREKSKDNFDLSVMIVNANVWDLSTSANVLILPEVLKSSFENFHKFYINHHNGRKLTLLYEQSKGELQISFNSRKYTLQVSTYQMIVLLLFNKALAWTVETIQDETQIKIDFLLHILSSLVKSKLLVCKEIKEDEADMKMNYSIQLATDFHR